MSLADGIEKVESIDFEQDAPPITNEGPAEELKYPDAPVGTCRVCGKPASSKAGKYCPEHKATHDKRKQRGKNGPKASAREQEFSRSTNDLKADLQASFAMLGFGWSMTGPKITPEVMQRLFPEMSEEQLALIEHPGNTLTRQSEQIADAFTHLADSNPRIRRWLELASSPSGYLAVGMSLMPVVSTAQLWYGVVIPRVKEVEAEVTDART